MKFLDKIYIRSKSQNLSWIIVKTLIQSAIFWLIFLWILPCLITSFTKQIPLLNFNTLLVLGFSLFGIFGALGIYSAIVMSKIGKGTPLPMDCAQKLVIKGPYKIVRNPMAVAGISQAIAVGFIFGSFAVIVYALIGAVLWHLLIRPSEERDLAKRFGKEYLDYQDSVKCWIPKF